MIYINKEDCELLYEEFKEYCQKNSQKIDASEYPLFVLLNAALLNTINNYDTMSQDDLKSMFISIYKVMENEELENKYREVQ